MRNGLWTKGFGIGMIILFLGASVLPNITARMEKDNTVADYNLNISAINYTFKFIGLIKDMMKNETIVAITCIMAFYWFYDDEGILYEHGITHRATCFPYIKQIGFIGKHIIFASFIV